MSTFNNKDFIRCSLHIRVYSGGYSSPQTCPFSSATPIFERLMQQCGKFHGDDMPRIDIEYRTVQDMRINDWSPMDLVQWLLQSDIHFIITHVHQGNVRWNVCEVHQALQLLQNHPGYPNGIELSCPVFLQHKYAYLLGVRQIVNFTLAFQLPTVEITKDSNGNIIYSSNVSDSHFAKTKLFQFLHACNEGDGWVVKLPFVTIE